jgi:hypothetical protein
MFVPGKPLQPSLLFMNKLELIQVKHLSGAPFYGRLLALPTNIRLGWKRNVGDKHSSLLPKFVTYGRKKFYNVGPQDGRRQKYFKARWKRHKNYFSSWLM